MITELLDGLVARIAAEVVPVVEKLLVEQRARMLSAFGMWLNVHRGETAIRADLELFTPAERDWLDRCMEDIKRRVRAEVATEMRMLTQRNAELEDELAAMERPTFTGGDIKP